ncbi:hypothetical protein LEP1GSC151_4442 [Leptospira interrogans serovar Grippotyphosa str. LT2186]|uniref:Uncharacterized protein n=3 Tax=Leptospira interrogans TaxID=173 RepID=A0A0E2D3G8_LEPIR|nr:hypothetical protein LEP1GSC069_4444 [Leptospira interrogans serovar Canicola str. Fiocruz LV133]EKR35741.1 hypothetical protein LEP1GSC096_3978 [Leptospira interrogans serovar Hebdomadis str. R499]EKR47214.1 hypothetical protein LEP1GSC097_4206 [Leptospira interrogans serovar Grippotyphosa str. UI 08368]EKR54517.1 hypothetical protein LEP1GSC105_2973 [Leptospira interrogans str. UI 12758]EKR83746.1 hypothetical protein LEP1GSC099_3439 [Leptospira interrogans str. UI 08452]EMG09446.1 hypoth
MFQNLEYEILLKKLTILGSAQFQEDFYIFKKITYSFLILFLCMQIVRYKR